MRRMTFSFLSPIHKATRQIALHLAGPCAEEGVSPPEGHLLSYLRSYGPCPISTLLNAFVQKPSPTTSMLQRLVDRGLIARDLHPKTAAPSSCA
jgi:DNA-binding MarR family transcriptional regulator